MSRSMTRRQAMQGLAALGPAALAAPAVGAPLPPAPLAAAARPRAAAQPAPIGPYDPDVLPAGGALALRQRRQRPPRPRPRGRLRRRPPRPAAAPRLPRARLQLAQRARAPGRRGATTSSPPTCAATAGPPGWDADYDGDLASFRRLNVVRDALGLVFAFGYREVAAVIGHDFGSPVAAWCARIRPDVFRSVALMSAPNGGVADLPFDTADDLPAEPAEPGPTLFDDLAALPRPRKHYQRYYRTREANANMWRATQGLHAFLRGYYHYKSADWLGNRPLPARGADGGRDGEDADLLHHGPRRRHGRDRRQAHAVAPTTSPPTPGCPTTSCASTPRSTTAPASRAA